MSASYMNYRVFNSRVELPEVGQGTWKYSGGPAPLRHGLDLGSTLIDTAESYGTEEVVGEAIRGLRHKVFLATKISPSHFRKRDVKSAAEASLRRLKTDYIDLYQLHWPNLIVPLEETMSAMEDLANDGKIRFIGVSNFLVRELRRAQAALSRHKIFSNQVRYSLIDRTIEGRLLDYCRKNQIAIIAFTPLGHGLDRLADMDPHGSLDRISQQCGKTRAQVALNWCLSKQGVVTIPKASTIERVAENCGASGWSLSAEQLRDLSSNIRFRRRGSLEMALRRTAKYISQRIGRDPA
jgi:diketogulonate reductase-like aldo/keto reductase